MRRRRSRGDWGYVAERTRGALVSERACAATTQRGTRCRGIVPAGRSHCLAHDPELRDKVQAARRRGGTVAMKLRHLQGRRQRLDSARALVKFLGDLAQDALAGTVAPDVARTVAYCVSIQKGLIESAEIERRLARLEARYADPGVRAVR
jgi:hypothetical protein